MRLLSCANQEAKRFAEVATGHFENGAGGGWPRTGRGVLKLLRVFRDESAFLSSSFPLRLCLQSFCFVHRHKARRGLEWFALLSFGFKSTLQCTHPHFSPAKNFPHRALAWPQVAPVRRRSPGKAAAFTGPSCISLLLINSSIDGVSCAITNQKLCGQKPQAQNRKQLVPRLGTICALGLGPVTPVGSVAF